jgi:hypothetical protein
MMMEDSRAKVDQSYITSFLACLLPELYSVSTSSKCNTFEEGRFEVLNDSNATQLMNLMMEDSKSQSGSFKRWL